MRTGKIIGGDGVITRSSFLLQVIAIARLASSQSLGYRKHPSLTPHIAFVATPVSSLQKRFAELRAYIIACRSGWNYSLESLECFCVVASYTGMFSIMHRNVL